MVLNEERRKIMKVISISECPEMEKRAIEYFQAHWASEKSKKVYEDCISHCYDLSNPLPRWYLLMDEEKIVGCAGLIANDFISRMDCYPWLCALYIDPDYRGHGYGKCLIDRAKEDAERGGFKNLYLCTDHIGYYEHYDFEYIGMGYHPWGESSRIYCAKL